MLVIIDNYDSFTYNLVQYFGELGATLEVFRNDRITVAEIERMQPEKLCVSPGPCTPTEAGTFLFILQLRDSSHESHPGIFRAALLEVRS